MKPVAAATTKAVHRRLSTEQAIYGTILVSAIIAIGFDDDTNLQVLTFTVGAVVVFWLAHVYAATLAFHTNGPLAESADGDTEIEASALVGAAPAEQPFVGLGAAFRKAVKHEYPMLLPLILPIIVLSASAIGLIEEWTAFFIALWLGVILLGVLGYVALGNRSRSVGVRLFGAFLTALLGMILIGLSALVH